MDTEITPSAPAAAENIVPPPSNLLSAEPEEFNEAQLRETYENEEIERFLNLFSRYVNEVKAQDTPETLARASTSVDNLLHEGEGHNGDDSGHPPEERCISVEVANNFLLPRLPPPRSSYQEFTVNRLRLAVQRLYPATVPHYLSLSEYLGRLATWENRGESLVACSGFWLLWWQDLLLAAFFFVLLLVLLKHRFFPYPSLANLRRRREEVHRANQVGEELSQLLSPTSELGVRDIWRLGKHFASTAKMKKPSREKRTRSNSAPPDLAPQENSDGPENTTDPEEAQESKRLALFVINEIADFHERIKNLYIWRRPASSWLYCYLLAGLFLATLFTPAEYIIKAASGTAGFLYWHATPVIAALPSKERLRLPPPLLNVPTDREYAMEIISQRVAAGLEIRPSNLAKARSSRAVPSSSARSTDSGSPRPDPKPLSKTETVSERLKQVEKGINSGKYLIQEGKRLFSRVQLQANQFSGLPTDSHGPSPTVAPMPTPNTHTFPAQHSSSPGLVTFTPTTFYFTPLTALYPTLTIATSAIKGVKKNGILKGLNIVWTETDSEGRSAEKLEKFIWIGNRDELFARVVSANAHVR